MNKVPIRKEKRKETVRILSNEDVSHHHNQLEYLNSLDSIILNIKSNSKKSAPDTSKNKDFRSASSAISENSISTLQNYEKMDFPYAKDNLKSPAIKIKEKNSDNSLFKLIPCGTNKSKTGEVIEISGIKKKRK